MAPARLSLDNNSKIVSINKHIKQRTYEDFKEKELPFIPHIDKNYSLA